MYTCIHTYIHTYTHICEICMYFICIQIAGLKVVQNYPAAESSAVEHASVKRRWPLP